MSLQAPPDQAPPGGPPRTSRRWVMRRLVPLVLLGVLGGVAHAAAAGVAVHEAALPVRHAGAARGGGAAPARPSAASAVTPVLTRMNAALAAHDLPAYLAELGPDAGLRNRQGGGLRA